MDYLHCFPNKGLFNCKEQLLWTEVDVASNLNLNNAPKINNIITSDMD